MIDKVLENIKQHFGEMKITRGKKHTFVGLNFEMLEDGTIKLNMKDYLIECIHSFQNVDCEIEGRANTPGKHDLFTLDENSPKLDEIRNRMFHHIVSKLLYVSKRARLDIDLVVSFLFTRVSRSTIQDWEKLRRLLTYLKNTIEMSRYIGAKNLSSLFTWVDAPYATHHDYRGHTGGVIGMGKGVVSTKSSKQKLNTKSSTETEIVGTSDYLPWTLWVTRFLEHQGYPIKKYIFYQDNESAIKIERNGRKSCGEKSRHIHIRYFFMADVIKRENITIKHCPTGEMIADFYTKPLQGSLFRKMRNYIMSESDSLDEKRVENQASRESDDTKTKKKLMYVEVLKKGLKKNLLKK